MMENIKKLINVINTSISGDNINIKNTNYSKEKL